MKKYDRTITPVYNLVVYTPANKWW